MYLNNTTEISGYLKICQAVSFSINPSCCFISSGNRLSASSVLAVFANRRRRDMPGSPPPCDSKGLSRNRAMPAPIRLFLSLPLFPSPGTRSAGSIWSWISSFFSWLRSKQNQICVVFPIESVPPAQRFCLFGGVPTCFAYNLLSCCLLYLGLGGVQSSTDLQYVGDLGNVEFDLLQLTEGGNSDKRRSFRSEEDSSKILVWCKVQLRFMLWCGMRR